MRNRNEKEPSAKEAKNEARNKAERRRMRYEKLDTGEGRKIGFFEALGLKAAGFRDGRRGYPHRTDEGIWYSTFMNREVNSCEEFCSHIWGGLQIENEDRFAELEEYMDGIRQKQKLLAEARRELAEAEEREAGIKAERKKGEEHLTGDQVLARRKAEREKKLEPAKTRAEGLRRELREMEEAFSDLFRSLTEDDDTTRMICRRVKDHTLMRADVYWNTALLYHPEGASMPVVPELKLKNDAEEAYIRNHREVMAWAASVQEAIDRENAREEAA